LLKRSRYMTTPGSHSGLGVAAYTQVTSPLRRYLDLVGHQQLRAYLKGEPLLDEEALLERTGAAEAIVGSVRLGEMLSEKHWTLVYLMQHPGWQGEGILVDVRGQHKRGATGIVLIPALAFETRIHLHRDIPLDGIITLTLSGVSLPQREASFRTEK
jgi:exoribonuclease II